MKSRVAVQWQMPAPMYTSPIAIRPSFMHTLSAHLNKQQKRRP